MRAYAMTATANKLEASAMKLRLEHPADVFNPGKGCKAPPYDLPDPSGGFITLLEFGEPDCDPGCSTPKPSCGGCGCGGSTCGNSKCSDPKCVPSAPATTGTLRRYEEIAYSGFDKDGKTLILTERAVSGLVDQEWPAGTLIMQSGAAPYITMIEKLGCIMAIPKAKDCLQVKEGQFVGDPTCDCWRQAKKDTVVTLDGDGILDYPAAGAAENEHWSQCYSLQQMLINALIEVPKLIEQLKEIQTLIDNGVYKNCAGSDLAKGSKVVACAEMGSGLVWNDGTKKYDVKLSDFQGALAGPAGLLFERDVRNSVNDPGTQTWEMDNELCYTLAQLGAPADSKLITLGIHALTAQHISNVQMEDTITRVRIKVGGNVIMDTKTHQDVGADPNDNPGNQNAMQLTLPVVDGKVCLSYDFVLMSKAGAATFHPNLTDKSQSRAWLKVWPVKWEKNGPN